MTCYHCGLPIPEGELVRDNEHSEERLFCCHGCHGAWLIITGAGLERFYRQRVWRAAGLPDGAYHADWNEEIAARYVVKGGECAELIVLLDGIRCASCIWLIEQILTRLDGVASARINFATHRARIRFDEAKIGAARILTAMTAIGYFPRPYTADEADRLATRTGRDLLVRFVTAAFFSMQLMGFQFALYAGYFQGMSSEFYALLQWCAAIVTTPVVFYAGWPFLRGAWQSLRNRTPNMDCLVAIGVLSSYGYSCVALLNGQDVYFDSAATIVTLILLGRLLEHAARRKAGAGIDRLLRLTPVLSHKIVEGQLLEVDSTTLRCGDLIQVRAGERFPVDGHVSDGVAEIDEAAVTGESLPVTRHPGDKVLAGTLNLSTVTTVEVSAPVSDSFIARIARLVEEAQARRAPMQLLADRISALFIPAVLLIAALTFGYWQLFGDGRLMPLIPAVAVLVVACPCALGLATPMAILVASGQSAAAGILFRGGDVLERTAHIHDVAFDKTGTLTLGQPQVVAVMPYECDEQELLGLAMLVESGSDHPLARAIIRHGTDYGLATPVASGGAKVVPGDGVLLADPPRGTLRLGRREFLRAAGIDVPLSFSGTGTEVHLARAERYLGAIVLADRLRPEAVACVAALRRRGLTTTLLTGDHAGAAAAVADVCRLDAVHAGLSPEEKAAWIEDATNGGRNVLMIGDGINDAPALGRAAVGCSLAGSTAIALESAELVLTRADLALLPQAIDLARATTRIVKQNFFWASIYNLLAIPLAAAGYLAPVHAAAAMALSSICVVVNSLRLATRKAAAC